ncbi:MAG: M18 family aminopeptidase [Bacilli bacterium]|nr:M18 family aminopeptidase [Bacilli bacterium]
MDQIEKIIGMLNKSHSSFGATKVIAEELNDNGYVLLDEKKPYSLEKGKGYYVMRNQSSIIAFKIPVKEEKISFHVAASHSDSPSFKVKPNPITVSCGTMQLQVEPYGGGIYHSWLDRPLSLSGRLVIKGEGKIYTKIIDIDEDLMTIPSVCIHFDRSVNEGRAFNPKSDMIPVIGEFQEGFDFNKWLAKKAKVREDEEILSYDLFLYVREDARITGINKEFLLAPREDNLTSAYSSLLGFMAAKGGAGVPVYVCFDNEEVGSLTRQGANSTFLQETLKRIAYALDQDYEEAVARSFMLSIDNAHANHPNHPELSGSPVILNGGVVIKYNANQKYTSDALSASLVKSIAKDNNIAIQEFTNRADLRGGSTLGNISNSEVSMLSCDIGIAQLAMHSSVETLGTKDLKAMLDLCKAYYSSRFAFEGEEIIF